MINFLWPWAFFALPLPWVVRALMPPVQKTASAALKVPFFDELQRLDKPAGRLIVKDWPLWFAFVAWILLVGATARPQWLGDPIAQTVSGRDLMLAVDLSGSMQEKDFVIQQTAVDRLTATKQVASEFIQRRIGDRIGLILFGENPYLQVPLTFDRDTVTTLLNESAIGLAGDATAIGDAIGLAVKRLKDNPVDQRVLILLTDGANTAGEVAPLKAAQIAADKGLKIYTLGIGADEMIVRSFFGTRRVNPSRDLDENTLREIAKTTGGRYFRARDTGELTQIYALIDTLEPVDRDEQFFRPQIALFHWPLALALLLAMLLLVYPLGINLWKRS